MTKTPSPLVITTAFTFAVPLGGCDLLEPCDPGSAVSVGTCVREQL
jgi:hypothetical protein